MLHRTPGADHLAPGVVRQRGRAGHDRLMLNVMPTTASKPAIATGPRRVTYFAFGGLFAVLGFAGIVLPGLPATPFLLLASWLFARSSPAGQEWLESNRYVGPALREWRTHRTVTMRIKCRAIACVFVGVAATVVLVPESIPLKLL